MFSRMGRKRESLRKNRGKPGMLNCPTKGCKYAFDAELVAQQTGAIPEEGDAILCPECRSIAVFDNPTSIRAATKVERMVIGDPETILLPAIQAALKNRGIEPDKVGGLFLRPRGFTPEVSVTVDGRPPPVKCSPETQEMLIGAVRDMQELFRKTAMESASPQDMLEKLMLLMASGNQEVN